MIKFDFKNKTAIVTGGAQGFGLDIANKFLSFGAKVIIWDVDQNETENIVKKINNENLSFDIVDVSNFDEVSNAANKITKSNTIDILINNAGITGPTAELWNYDVNEWKKIVDINLVGTFNCCKVIVPNTVSYTHLTLPTILLV